MTTERLLSQNLPVLPTRNVVIFPGSTLPINVGRARSIAGIEAARLAEKGEAVKRSNGQDLLGGWLIAVAQRSDLPSDADPDPADLFKVGTLCKIEKVRGTSDKGYQILLRGVSRVHIDELLPQDKYLAAKASLLYDHHDVDDKTLGALVANIKKLAHEILDLIPANTRQLEELIDGLDEAALLVHLCAEHIDVSVVEKQEILAADSIKQRCLRLLELMQHQKEALQLQSEIREKLSQKMGKMQREAILREQLRTIREELGDTDGASGNDDYSQKINDAGMPEEVRKIAIQELKRFEAIGNSSPEAHVIRNYLDLLCSLPWSKSSDDRLDLEQARASLNEDHYGLDKIKRRIIQHLAVMKLKKGGRGSILLLVGPPGVGKTSLGQSIAKALGRQFVRTSLGGVRDDAEIRGHRRTYIGAMPGRIVQGIKRAGVNNPVVMLDEIDKLGRGYAGDPAAALLEVLDPEQNATFTDHYLDVPFDLSKVFFIATANSLESIPGPLLDRMEVVELSGYTTAEKLHIAKNHLWPKQLAEHGLTNGDLKLSDEALMRIITHYTREAGVRDLQRHLATLCRISTEAVVVPDASLPVKIELVQLEEALGPERFVHEVAERLSPPGVVTGLAWTPQGGEILFIEASLMPGTGKLILTGQLGEVMKESAQIALSLVRNHLPAHVPGFEYEKKDIHVHVPAGAIPKDGPSAGITMLTTLASLFTKRSVSSTLAMTGEITLRGAVMPVGGIKEKVMAAHRAGIERIILARRNEKDLREVPEEVRAALKIDFVDHVAEVLKLALDLDVTGPLPVMTASQAAAPVVS